MKAVHFGAGNIGRGFVGLILHKAGYEIVFADVAAPLIDALAAADSYKVHEVGEQPHTWTVNNFRALNSASNEAAVIDEIATADMVTTAVGPNILKFVAPLIANAIKNRAEDLPPLQVLALKWQLRWMLKCLPRGPSSRTLLWTELFPPRVLMPG